MQENTENNTDINNIATSGADTGAKDITASHDPTGAMGISSTETKIDGSKPVKKGPNRNFVLLGIILAVIIISFGIITYIHYTAQPKLEVVVQYVDREIFRAPLGKDAMYMIKDGEVTEVSMDTTLASMGDEALETRHHINLVLVKDNAVSVVESNCQNQVCVSIGKLTGSDYDFPITCLPHGLIIVVQ